MLDPTGHDCPDDFSQILQEAVVNKRCGNCGTDTIMNAAYARYAPGPLLSCRHCRNPGEKA